MSKKNTVKMNIKVQDMRVKVTTTNGEISIATSIAMLIVLLGIFIILIAFYFVQSDDKIRFGNLPEKIEQAEVVGRRSESNGGRMRIKTYIVAFKLADGSEKELAVGTNGSQVYNALQKGITGKLIYKEIESDNGAKNFRSHRRFISFEKDPAYGGETLRITFLQTLAATAIFYFTPWLILLSFIFVSNIKRQVKQKKIPTQVDHVKVVKKRKQECISFKKNDRVRIHYFVAFKFSDGLKKDFLVGRDDSKAYDFFNEGDTGKLVYKKLKARMVSFCFDKDPHVLEDSL